MYWNDIDERGFGSFKIFKIKNRRGHQKIKSFCIQPKKLGPHSSISRTFQKTEEIPTGTCGMHLNDMNDEECGTSQVWKVKYKKGDQYIQSFCRIRFPKEIRSPVVIFRTFKKTEKITTYPCRMHGDEMNNKDLHSSKLSKLKY